MRSNIIIFILLLLTSCADFSSKFKRESIITHNSTTLSLTWLLILVLITLFVTLFVGAIIIARARTSRIKRIYKATRSKLHFWDKLDRNKLESALQENYLPEHWFFSLNKDKTKIENIYYHSRLKTTRIAADREIMYDSLKKQLDQMKK